MYLKGKNKKMKSLLVTFLKTLKNNNESKLMKCMVNCDYYVYYFWQDNFLFILATQISDVQYFTIVEGIANEELLEGSC